MSPGRGCEHATPPRLCSGLKALLDPALDDLAPVVEVGLPGGGHDDISKELPLDRSDPVVDQGKSLDFTTIGNGRRPTRPRPD